jgi:hypothetical protein
VAKVRDMSPGALRYGPDGFARPGFDLLPVQLKDDSGVLQILGVDLPGWNDCCLASGLGALGVGTAGCGAGACRATGILTCRRTHGPGLFRYTTIYGIAAHE